MHPTFRRGALLAVTPLRDAEPRRGEIVVARRPGGIEIVKRVVATPGGAVPGYRTLGPDEFWLAGDNESGSTDSRELGPFRRDALVGRVRACYWPPRSWRVFAPRGDGEDR